MNACVIRATARWFTPADPSLGACPPQLRLVHYNALLSASGLRRDPMFRLRELHGIAWKNSLPFLPIPRHRALVAVGPINRHERHPLHT